MKKLESTDPRIQQALVLYKSGTGIRALCDQFHIDGSVLRRFITEAGLLRTKSEAVRSAKSNAKINDRVLEILTPEALYWIGFLYADGHIEKEPRARISLTLAEIDRGHLEKYGKFFGEGLEIRDVTNKNSKAPGQINFDGKHLRVAFSSKSIYSKLMQLGLTHKKTLNLIPIESLKNSKDFWRGVVDGDGWICQTGDMRAEGKYNYACIGLSGTQDTLIGFLDFIKRSGITTDAHPRKDSRSNVWKTDIHGTGAKAIMTLLYKDATVYLDRKYEKYQELMNEPKCLDLYNIPEMPEYPIQYFK